ncbi:MAG: hypothetical protein J6Z35_10085 [Lachnospiraceae bacterium]|nr:hypothetical protein [Lachnospiraceae bacterium]
MKKIKWLSVLVICICLAGCGKEGSSSGNTPVKEVSEVSEVSEAAEQPVKEETNAGKEEDGKTEDNKAEDSKAEDNTVADNKTEDNKAEESKTEDGKAENADQGSSESKAITGEQALLAIKNYCYLENPSLKDIEEEGEYSVYWDISSCDESQIVILFHSYTGALIRYYIDPVSGETYITEFVPGILLEEERSDVTFNVRDYME